MQKRELLAVGRLIDLFLSAMRAQAAPSTCAFYANFLQVFRAHAAGERVDDLTASFVYKWIAKFYGRRSQSTRHAAARSVTRMINWAVDERLIDRSPLAGFRKPPAGRREATVTPAQYAACLRAANLPLRAVIKFLYHTGCRPQEVRAVRIEWCNAAKIVLPISDSKGKRRGRILYLDGMAQRQIQHIATLRKQGAVFRNAADLPWTKNSLVLAFRRLRERTGIVGLCAYSFRHSHITRLLERGIDVATVAAISGNSPRMILGNYNHVANNESRLLAVFQTNRCGPYV